CPFQFLTLPSGVSSGSVLVFDVPSKGSNIILSEVLEEHKEAITDMASECSGNLECIADLVSADDSGLLCVWKSGEDFHLLNKILVLSMLGINTHSTRDNGFHS
ncbi:hypothetical protein cypCar_00028293, partial [Cyprinus carpio]